MILTLVITLLCKNHAKSPTSNSYIVIVNEARFYIINHRLNYF